MLFTQTKKHEHGTFSLRRNTKADEGFTIAELMVVIAVMMILTVFSIFALQPNKKLYRTDDEAQRIVETLRQASYLALTHRHSMRMELNASQKWIRIVDEKDPSTATDDVEVSRAYLNSVGDVKVDAQPTGVGAPNPPNYAAAVYAGAGNTRAWTLRYKLDGTVEKTGGNVTSATLYIYPPDPNNSNAAVDKKRVRAITIFGGTGAIRLWKYDGTKFVSY